MHRQCESANEAYETSIVVTYAGITIHDYCGIRTAILGGQSFDGGGYFVGETVNFVNAFEDILKQTQHVLVSKTTKQKAIWVYYLEAARWAVYIDTVLGLELLGLIDTASGDILHLLKFIADLRRCESCTKSSTAQDKE